jgi:hypothetical protein
LFRHLLLQIGGANIENPNSLSARSFAQDSGAPASSAQRSAIADARI